MEIHPNGYMYKTLLHKVLREHCGREARVYKPEDQGICCEIVSSSNVRNYTHKLSPVEQELRKANNNRDAKMDEETPKASTLYRAVQTTQES